MTHLSPSKRFALGALALTLTACTVPAPAASPGPGFDLLGPERGLSAGIRINLQPGGRHAQTVPSDWATASFVLSNPATLVANRRQDLVRASFVEAGGLADSTAVLFPNTRPGAGYTLYASTYRDSADGPLRNALGYQTGLTLRPNESASVRIPLATLFPWTAQVLANVSGLPIDDNVPGDQGDGGLPSAAKFKLPMGIAFAPDGTLYVADQGDARIRTITATRDRIETLVQLPGARPRALVYAAGLDNQADVLFLTDTSNARVSVMRGLGTTNVVATLVPFLDGTPNGMCYDPVRKRLYVSLSDGTLARIDVTNLASPQVTTMSIAMSNASFSNPQGLALNADGTRLYVADTGRYRVLEVNLDTLQASVLAGSGAVGDVAKPSEGDGGLATAATFKRPVDLVYDAFDGGHLYVMDTDAKVVRVVTLRNGLIATAWGDGGTADVTTAKAAQRATLLEPAGMGLMVDGASSSLYVSDRARIRSTVTP
ncbi:NHL repeat protein [compost metagenome]